MFVVASLTLMTIDHRLEYLDKVRGHLLTGIYPLQVLVDFPIRASDWAAERLSSRENLMTENKTLRREQLLINSRLSKFAQLRQKTNG